MRSPFSFDVWPEPAGDQPLSEPVPGDLSVSDAPQAAAIATPAANLASTPAEALTAMLSRLSQLLADQGGSNPAPESSVAVASITERALAIGNRRGTERRSPLTLVELKGGRLEGTVRFQLWGEDLDEVEAKTTQLHQEALAIRDELRAEGFLRMAAEATSVAEHVPNIGAWRQTADYRVLYEYHCWDTDEAESIIARIPIHGDLEERDSLARETTVVTDEMVRWDGDEAPPLELAASVASSWRFNGLAILVHLPAGWTGNQVTLARLSRASPAPPTTYPNLDAFHAAVTDPVDPDRHAQVVFNSVVEFQAVFEPVGDPIELGRREEDGTPYVYQPGVWSADPPIRLGSEDDLIRVSYQDPTLEGEAVVYVRAQARRL